MTDNPQKIKYVDVEKGIRESKSKLLKKLPRFVIQLIARIIKQNEMNRLLQKYENAIGFDFLNAVAEEFKLNIIIEGLENLPENKKCFFVANHPFGVIDGLILTRTVYTKYGGLKAIGNDAFRFIPQLTSLIAAVNVFDGSSREYIKALEETYEMDIPITHFPAGQVSRFFKGKVQDNVWHKSFIAKAVSCQRDVVPFHFYGRNSILFYSIFKIRNFFGIKANIELMLLPREMFLKRGKTIRLKIGKPIPYQKFDQSHTQTEWAQKVREHVHNLGQNKTDTQF